MAKLSKAQIRALRMIEKRGPKATNEIRGDVIIALQKKGLLELGFREITPAGLAALKEHDGK